MDKTYLPNKPFPCGLVACEHHGNYCYNCDKEAKEIMECPIFIPDERYIEKIDTTCTEVIKKPTLKQIVDIRNLAKYITIEIIIKTKGKFLFNIGLNIMKFGAWITGCNIQVIENKEINTEAK